MEDVNSHNVNFEWPNHDFTKRKKIQKKLPSLIDESYGCFISCIANKCVIKLIFQVTYVMLFGPCIRGKC